MNQVVLAQCDFTLLLMYCTFSFCDGFASEPDPPTTKPIRNPISLLRGSENWQERPGGDRLGNVRVLRSATCSTVQQAFVIAPGRLVHSLPWQYSPC